VVLIEDDVKNRQYEQAGGGATRPLLRRQNNWATPQSRRELHSAVDDRMTLQEYSISLSVLFCIGKRTKECCDRGSEVEQCTFYVQFSSIKLYLKTFLSGYIY